MNAKRIVNRLLDLRNTSNEALIGQLNDLTTKLRDLEDKIIAEERSQDDFIYGLYGVDAAEQAVIEQDTARRADARFPRRCE